MKGYIPLRRGLLDHLKIMSFSELKVYIGLLLLANYKNGYVKITVARLADTLGTDYKNTLNSIHRLDKLGYVKYTPAKNQWQDSQFKITKFNKGDIGSVNNTQPPPEAVPEAVPEAPPQAKVVNGSKGKGLRKTQKLKEVKRSYKKVKYLEFVYLTDKEHLKLVEKFGEAGAKAHIETLNNYVGSHGKKYASHYYTILSWASKDKPEPQKKIKANL